MNVVSEAAMLLVPRSIVTVEVKLLVLVSVLVSVVAELIVMLLPAAWPPYTVAK